MTKYVVALFLLIPLVAVTPAQPLIRVAYDDFVLNADIALDVAFVRSDAYVDIVGWEQDIKRLDERGIAYEIVIPDLPQHYSSRLCQTMPMGGYRTFSEIVAAMDSLHDLYPDIVSGRDSISAGWDGNIVWAMKISDNVAVDEDEPEVLYDATIHAREIICPEVLLYFMHWLCEGYGTNPLATYMVNEREMWFIPVVNPDGYVRNEIDNPGGGGMWRKNTRDNNENGTFDTDYDGVDMNRNYGYMWGTGGSSSYPGDDTYMGPNSFSEPAIQGYRDFVLSRQFVTNLTYHSYSALYLFPWGYTYSHCPDHDLFMMITDWMAECNGYVHGNGSETIYLTSGTTFDWMYGEYDIISITPEVGGSSDGFWPPIERKLPLCQEQLLANIIIGLIASAVPGIYEIDVDETTGDGDGYPDVGESGSLGAIVRNTGIESATDVSLFARAITGGIAFIESTATVSGSIVSKGGIAVATGITFSIASPLLPGETASVEMTVAMPDGYLWTDTVDFIIGTPEAVYENGFESGYSDWSFTGDWEVGTPTERPIPHSAPNVLGTDLDPGYLNDTLSIATGPIYFVSNEIYKPHLSFWHWYEIEGDPAEYYDGGQVQIRILPGSDWNTIEPDGGYPAIIYEHNPYIAEEPAFSGSISQWERVSIDLSLYVGDSVQIRLIFATDMYADATGWFIDDWTFGGFEPETTAAVAGEKITTRRPAIKALPNPFNSICRIETDGTEDITIIDIGGRTVRKLTIADGAALWNALDDTGKPCPAGIYFVVPSGSQFTAIKLLLVR